MTTLKNNIPKQKLLRGLIILFIFISGTLLHAQSQSFNLTVQNIIQTGGRTLEFDVFLQNTDPSQSFELASCQLGFLMNSLIYTGGNLSAKIDNSGSGLNENQQFTVKPVVENSLSGYPDRTLVRLGTTPKVPNQGTIISSVAPGTLLTRFILTSSVDFKVNSTPDITFTSSTASSPLSPTKVEVFIIIWGGKYKKQLTVTPGVNALVNENPVLNPMSLPEVFEVTGTGAYCSGTEGLPVGLNGSQSGVKYTLFKNNVPLEPSIEGTGREITFGNQLSGTYTVTGANEAGLTEMKGSAVISENPSPSAPVPGIITDPLCDMATGSVIINGLPEDGPWTLLRDPGNVSIPGNGSSTIVSELSPGTYTFKVINSLGCISVRSVDVTIKDPPPLPAIPEVSVNCSAGYGKAVVTVNSPVGDGFEYRLDNGVFQATPVFNLVANGNHTVTVRNSFGCTTTGPSFEIACGCANPPVIIPGSLTGITCGTAMITVTNNRFGGSATSVTITENGGGTVIPVSTNTTPFDFVYVPVESDIGKTILITITTNNPDGFPCEPATDVYTLTVSPVPTPPVPSTITQPTCAIPTGSVILSGLPASGTWELTRNPGNVIITGTGTSTTIAGLTSGTYTFIVKNSTGCSSESSSDVIIQSQPQTPAAPVVATITQPTCTDPSGSVMLSGLPQPGSWTVTVSPGGITKRGEGPTTTITGLTANSYTFIVANANGCVSQPSANVVIQAQPETPTPPVPGTMTPPTCSVATGSILLTGLPAQGSWTITRYPGAVKINGSGISRTVSGLQPGTYYFTVTSASGCTSAQSGYVIIPVQPITPQAPVIGQIIQPTHSVATGSVILTGLPASYEWKLTRYPGGIITPGTGTSVTVSGLQPGTYTFTVTSPENCTSPPSAAVVINEQPGPVSFVINDPPTICSTITVDLTNPAITAGSDERLTFSYWIDKDATKALHNPTEVSEGTFYIKGTLTIGDNTDYFEVKPVNVTADQMPVADAGPDQVLINTFEATMDALQPEYGTGIWSVLSGSGNFSDNSDPKTGVTNLIYGRNDFLWTVSNGVCPKATDELIIIVEDLLIPSLITPDMDGKNDYLVLRGLTSLGKTEIVIFDRRGAKVYWNSNYDNTWNGIDHKGNLLPDDTYFYIIRTESGKSMSGFIVVRR